MNELTSKAAGGFMHLVGMIGILAVLTLFLFFVGLFGNIPALSGMGSLNDTINVLAGLLSAVLASILHPSLRRLLVPRLSLALLAGVWVGALAIAFGSWLIMTDRSGVELSGNYFFFGNGLIGIWLWALNRTARQQAVWPYHLTRWGLIASVFMMLGLLGLYGILLGLDGDGYSPLVMVAGISILGTGIFYPIWCLRLGRWILGNRDKGLEALHGE
jgi:hypothetical protein